MSALPVVPIVPVRPSALRDASLASAVAAWVQHEPVASVPAHEREQAELLAMVVHELRKPLAPIRVAATLLRRAETDPAMLAHVQAVIERQVDHMSRLVSDLLDASRIRTGKLSLERRRVDLVDVVEAAAETCRTAIEGRRQRFEIERPDSAIEIDGDAVRLTQVLVNLLDNASKFTPRNGVVSLSLAARAGSAVIDVCDTGIGITADEAARIFEPFTQSPRASGFQRGGLGIGLSIVRELVAAHGGTIDASSAGKGQGSRFAVTLPLAVAASRAHANAHLDDTVELRSP